MGQMHSIDEVRLLDLLLEAQQMLSRGIDSLNPKAPPPQSIDCQYLQISASVVNRVADAYLILRKAHRIDASKLLVRPALEAVFNGKAVMKEQGFLTRKAHSEWKEERKMFPGKTAEAAMESELEDFKVTFLRGNPGYPVDWSHATVRDAAEAAGMLDHYQVAYRIYCKFTHNALGAVSGGLNSLTDEQDTPIILYCAIFMLKLLKQHTPANIPDLDSLLKKVPFECKP